MMSDPTLAYCVGATKAGTSWLYRYLHDHPNCALPAVKEAHYWDTFDPDAREKQCAVYRVRLREMRDLKDEAYEADRGWQVENLKRRIGDMKALLSVLEGNRARDLHYATWLLDRGQTDLVADMTPNYALLSEARLEQMLCLTPTTKFVFVIRDPLDRLWSHIRMQARRQRQSHEIYEKKANNILYRMLNRGQETHILERGDYPMIIEKLRRVIPPHRLNIVFTEVLMRQDGLSQLCNFLGISHVNPSTTTAVHKGPEVVMLEKLRPKALRLLEEHYIWVAENIGPLPDRWQENYARMTA